MIKKCQANIARCAGCVARKHDWNVRYKTPGGFKVRYRRQLNYLLTVLDATNGANTMVSG